KLPSNRGGRAIRGYTLNNRSRNNSRVQANGNLLFQVFLRQLCPGIRASRAVTGLDGEADFHLTRLGIQAAIDRRLCINLVARQTWTIWLLDARQQGRALQEVCRLLVVVTGRERQRRVICTS